MSHRQFPVYFDDESKRLVSKYPFSLQTHFSIVDESWEPGTMGTVQFAAFPMLPTTSIFCMT